ncbi:MAG: response regulator, partial [Pyrinomonadaceae bacterium]|nr:response regulator [Pyrinomonadaceae bacterium]
MRVKLPPLRRQQTLPMHVSHTSRVLIVEDDEHRCHWFRRRLDSYELDITCDATQAIRWLVERDYNLILLD